MTLARRVGLAVRANADIILVGVLSVLATVPFGRLFINDHYVWEVAGAAGIAVAATSGLGRRSVTWAIVAATIGLAAYLMVVVFHSGPQAAWTGTASSWSDLLTSTVPAAATARLVAAPVVLGWGAALIGSLLAVRTRPSAGPLVPPMVVLVAALAFAGTRPPGSWLLPAAIVIVAVALLVVRAQPDGPTLGLGGRTPTALITLAGVGALAVALGTAAPPGSAQNRFDLRARYKPPPNLSNQITPLAQVTPSLQDPSTTPIFTVRFTGIPPGANVNLLPIAVLDNYDGAVWGTTASFALAGPDLPPGPITHAPAATVQQSYHLTGYPSTFLPALERPTSIHGATLGFDRTTGVLVNPSGPGATLSYTVVSDLPQINSSEIDHSQPGVDPTVATLTLPPPGGWPTALLTFAQQHATGSTPLARLESLDNTLRSPSQFGYSTNVPPGHNLGVLENFLDEPNPSTNPDGRLGDPEQFAAAFATLARIEGFPSRVVVGYRINPNAVAAGQTIPVLPKDIYAWTEVNLKGLGWVTFDPTDTTPRKAPPPPKKNTVSVAPTTIPGQPYRPAGHGSAAARSNGGGPAIWVVAILIVLILTPAAILITKHARKRRRRDLGTPAQRILGAWKEIRDQLHDRNLHIQRSATPREASTEGGLAHRTALASGIEELGPLIDLALYAPEPPNEPDAHSAWELEAQLEQALRKEDTPIQRIRASLDPRTLVGTRRDGR